MADQIMKSSPELSAIVPEIWSANFYPTLKEKMVFADSVSKDYENEIRNLGDTVNISEFPQFDVANDLPEGTRNDAESLTVSSTPLIINKRTVKDYVVTSKAATQSLEHANQLRDLAMHSIVKKMQQDIIADIVPSPSGPAHAISYDAGTTLALADNRDCRLAA